MTEAARALADIRRLCDENLGPSRSSLLDRIAHIADSALAALPPAGWRDISTAPKDGTRVLLADADIWMVVARFWPCNMYWTEDAASGWKLNEPSHWMPLPSAPQRTGE